MFRLIPKVHIYITLVLKFHQKCSGCMDVLIFGLSLIEAENQGCPIFIFKKKSPDQD